MKFSYAEMWASMGWGAIAVEPGVEFVQFLGR